MLAVMGKQDEMLRSFGRRFQLLRQEKDLSQTAIAAMLQSYGVNITASHLSLVEKNKRKQRADDVFVSGTMDGERYRRQVDRLMSQMSTAQAEIDKLRTRHANEADTAARRQRIEAVSSIGLAKLDGEPTAGNAWLRRHVRMWAQDGRIVSVEWL